jgi:DNA polymerase-3 subunit gamma/tau
MYQALYRKYRPKTFDEVVGQDVIVKTLKNSIKNNLVSHAYLLAGPRGTGKTSIAKIFAKVLNCYEPVDFEPCNKCISCEQANNNQNIDIIEIDAASNNGVDEIREIRNKISLVPTNSKYKVYIIDEVHMLTTQAFNALLKTLEEPPKHIIFIFATTEPQKLPQTILSRCQRFDYKKVSNDEIVRRLKFIAEQENINIDEESLYEIAKLSDGGMRDSISLLDQALAYSDDKITIEEIHEINGSLAKEELDSLILSMLNGELVDVIEKIEKYDTMGKNLIKIVQEIIERMKDCLLYINAPKLVDEKDKFYKKAKDTGNTKFLYRFIKSFSSIINEMKNSGNNKILLEIEIIKNVNYTEEVSYIPNMGNISQEIIKPIQSPITEKAESKKISVKEESVKVAKPKVKKKILEFDKTKLTEFKKGRITNSLSRFSQKEREKVKKELEALRTYITDEKIGKNISLLLDGELKAVTENYLMFMYNIDLMAETFNINIPQIEDILNSKLKSDYKVIAIDSNDWDFLKQDYNKNKSSYVFKEELIKYEDLIPVSEDENNEKKDEKNSIAEMFNDIIEYE